MKKLSDRVKGSLIGLAMGDSLGWPAMFQRSNLLPSWTRRLRREIDTEAERNDVVRPAVPFSLNRSQEPFSIGPANQTEWAAFMIEQLLAAEGEVTEAELLAAWQELAAEKESVKGGLSIIAALNNLEKGLEPPASGHDNPHYFDDGACIRAVPIGIYYAGVPEQAAKVAGLEARITNSEDGVWAAKGMAAAIAKACDGGQPEEMVTVLQAQLPGDSWINRKLDQAVEIAVQESSLLAAIPRLSDEVANSIYSYGTTAPETLPLAAAIMMLAGEDVTTGLMGATAIARTADSVPALVGSLSGALADEKFVSSNWEESLRFLKGICLPSLEDVDYLELIDKLTSQVKAAR